MSTWGDAVATWGDTTATWAGAGASEEPDPGGRNYPPISLTINLDQPPDDEEAALLLALLRRRLRI